MSASRLETLRRRLEADPGSAAFAALAEEYRRLGRHAEAIELCEEGLQRHPDYASARVTLGCSLLETGEVERARHELQLALDRAPDNLAARRALDQVTLAAGGRSRADEERDGGTAASAPAPEPDSVRPRTTELNRPTLDALEAFLRGIESRRHDDQAS